MSQPASLRRALMEVFEVRSWRKRFRAVCRTIARFSAACPALTRFRLDGRRGPAPSGRCSRCPNGSGLPGAVFGRPSPGWRCNSEVPNCQNAHPIRCRSSQYHHHHPLYRRLVHARHFNTCTPTLGESGCLGPGTRSGLARLLLPDDTAAGQAYTAGSGTLTFVASETSRPGWENAGVGKESKGQWGRRQGVKRSAGRLAPCLAREARDGVHYHAIRGEYSRTLPIVRRFLSGPCHVGLAS